MSEVKTNKISSVSTNGDLTLDPNGTGEVIIANNHNVGIGDTTTGDVTNDGTAARTYVSIIGTANRGRLNLGCTASDGADIGTLGFTNGTNTAASISVDGTSGSQTSGKMSFATAGTVRMNISGGGNVYATGEGGGQSTIDLRQGSMKAWLYAASNSTFFDSSNISSTSDQGTGNYDYNFTNNMNNDDYAITCNALYAELAQPEGSSRSTSTFTIRVFGRQDSLTNQDQGNSAVIAGDIA